MARTEAVEKASYLRQWEVPYEALAYVFGHNEMSWSRLITACGRPSLVGTTLKDPEQLPTDLVADEKPTWRNGEKVYLATTAARGCLLGVSGAQRSSGAALTTAYGAFAAEARQLAPDYAPQSVCCDGGKATQQAGSALFVNLTMIRCFLPLVLKIKERGKSDKALWTDLQERAGDAYHAAPHAPFAARVGD